MLTFYRNIEETFEDLEIAKRYYSILFSIYGTPVTKQEVSFISYIAIQGKGIFSSSLRDSFITQYKVPKAAIYNMISKLKKINVLIKEDKKVKLNKSLFLNLDSGSVTFKIKLKTPVLEAHHS